MLQMSGFTFMIVIIVVFILISIQFTLNMILREIKAIRIRLGADPNADDSLKTAVGVRRKDG